MRQTFLLILLVAGIPSATLGQAPASDAQTLRALLTEVRELRRDLRASLARIQVVQILLSRVQTHQKDVRTNLKRLEDGLSTEQNPEQQKELRDRINNAKSELEESTYVEQYQSAEADADQQLRIEQDKLNALEAQLDDLAGDLDKTDEQRVPVAH